MGMTYTTGRATISDSQLPPHLRALKAKTQNYIGGAEPSVANYRKIKAGADIAVGQAFSINSSGDAIPAGSAPAHGIALNACAAGSDCFYSENVDIVNEDWNFTPGQTVWLSPSGTPTTETPAVEDGIICQELGMALDEHTLTVKIGLGRITRV